MEFNVLGIFVNGALLAALIAGLLQFPLRAALARLGVYRLVWHRTLFELSLFVLLWGAAVSLLRRFQDSFPAIG